MANNVNAAHARGVAVAAAVAVVLILLTRHPNEETIRHPQASLDLADQEPRVERFHGRQLRNKKKRWKRKGPALDPRTVELKAPAWAGGGRPLVHVINPFRHPGPSGFAPLGFEQWSTLASVRRAKQNFAQSRSGANRFVTATGAFNEVLVVCAVMEMDIAVLNEVLSNYCDRVQLLTRNTAAEYPTLDLKPLPFVQDIIDVGVAVGNAYGEFHLMMTNSDICLTEDYYTHLHGMMTESPGTAFTINRMTIPHVIVPEIIEGSSFDTIHEAAMNLLQQATQVYEQGKFAYHPGVDCFVAHSSVWNAVQFGDLFLGFPPFDWHVRLALEIFAPSYQEVRSNAQGTFHLADERAWKQAGPGKFPPQFGPLGPAMEMLRACPRLLNAPTDQHSLLNGINCGKLFQPPGPDIAPGFVRAGYEDIYKQAFVARGQQIGNYAKAFPGRYCKTKCKKMIHFLRNKKKRNQFEKKFGSTADEGIFLQYNN